MDIIQLTGIRAYGYTGAFPEEKILGQWFEVDITLWLDLSQAGNSDLLADTHDYGAVVESTQQIVQTHKFNLIERLAAEIARSALKSDGRLHQAQVRVSKLSAPIPDFSGKISVEITRDRTTI